MRRMTANYVADKEGEGGTVTLRNPKGEAVVTFHVDSPKICHDINRFIDNERHEVKKKMLEKVKHHHQKMIIELRRP